MNKTKINVDQIVKVRTFLNSVDPWYHYKKAKTFLGIVIRKEGFYDWMNIPVTAEEIQSDGQNTVVGEQIYYKPHVEIFTTDGKKMEVFFNTVQEVNDFMGSPDMLGVRWINV